VRGSEISDTTRSQARQSDVAPLTIFRVAQGLTQRELARAAGCSPATVYNAEARRHRPRELTVRAIADALGVEVEELFG
jgi:transcriptional regulator with XRE-family HTH domain